MAYARAPRRRFSVDTDASGDREASFVVQAPEVDKQLVSAEQCRHRFVDGERNPQRARQKVARSAGENADGNRHSVFGERTGDFHHGAVTAENEHRVVTPAMRRRQLGGVSRMLSEQDVALIEAARQGAVRATSEPFAAARCRVGDEHRLPDQKRHVCDSRKLKFCGVGTTPMKLCRTPQVRLYVGGS
jgi:hypothetical protein